MDEKTLKHKIENLSIWTKGDQRAPHKPLLLLYALARYQRDKIHNLSYLEVKDKLKKLLIEFGPQRRSYHPEQPFVRLTNDGIWSLNKSIEPKNIRNNYLMKNDLVGGFNPVVIQLLNRNPKLLEELADKILHEHFPQSIHEDILMAVGLEVGVKKRKTRDPMFRDKILRAYEYSCAVCGFNVRLGNHLVGIEAAHIKWFQLGGPDIEENGIALCSLHHKLFDRGVFTLTNKRQLIVAEDAHGTHGFDEWLMRYHGNPIREPVNPIYQPQETFLNWHVREVFKGPARYQTH
ncbi:phosphorothioated DNA-binding restriction endonuclease [Pseudalkalibacillus berkeleyi]|uniref:HNH endonuclease n=1 Tax=Pseudalkalibacillus berkeleyi TaxID=1069813 RepID=A0ABS9GY23_9BACL|nr:HNH endonuclease [Pseudalkalibacillus berkeleyi]MCF6136529.1 HNH endonuclease [Pseudalkalibacillus berkeleyi]